MDDPTPNTGKTAGFAEASAGFPGAPTPGATTHSAAEATKKAVTATQAAATATAQAAKAHMTEVATKTGDAIRQATEAGKAAVSHTAATGEDMARRAHETVSSFAHTAAERQQTMVSDMARVFKDMRFPSMIPDSGALMAAHRRNMEALSAANRMALEGAQAVARRHMEIMQSTMSELSEHVREIASTDTPQLKAAKQAELIKKSYERAVTNIRELSDLIQRSNGEALTLLNERFTEAMEEVKQLLEKAGEQKH
jgi:phasin family protein